MPTTQELIAFVCPRGTKAALRAIAARERDATMSTIIRRAIERELRDAEVAAQ